MRKASDEVCVAVDIIEWDTLRSGWRNGGCEWTRRRQAAVV